MTTEDIAGLVERLREWKNAKKNYVEPIDLIHKIATRDCHEAASAVEHLAGEVERLADEVRVRRIADHDVLQDEVLRTRTEGRIAGLEEADKMAREMLSDYCIDYWDALGDRICEIRRAALGDTPAGLDRQGPRDSAGS